MASTAVTERTYPKRKRAEISYHESSSDESQGDDEYSTSDKKLTTAARKKLKSSSATVSARPLPKRKIFPFMSLPAELKNQIYALALTDANGTPETTVLPSFVPNILLLNQTIYAEAQPILYGSNTFAVEDTTAMHAFLAIIGLKNRATITDLTVKGWGHTKAHKALNHPAFTLLAGAVNLTRLNIDCAVSWRGSKGQAKQLYRDGFHWLEAMGASKGKFDAALDILEVGNRFLGIALYGGLLEDPAAGKKDEDFRAELRKLLSWR